MIVALSATGSGYALPRQAAASASTSAAAPTTAQRVADPASDPALQREIARLADRDREVRAHEQAHLAAGADLITSGPTYGYTTGPDRRRYATSGEVGIDTSPVRGDPEATIAKAQRVRAAALAPAQPSGQDRQVAAQAGAMEQSARLELARQQRQQAYADTTNPGADRRGLQVAEFA